MPFDVNFINHLKPFYMVRADTPYSKNYKVVLGIWDNFHYASHHFWQYSMEFESQDLGSVIVYHILAG